MAVARLLQHSAAMQARSPVEGTPKHGSGVPLRWVIRAGNVALATIALIACVSLVVLTTMLQRVSGEARSSAEALREAEAARVELLVYGRVSDIAFMAKSPSHELERVRTEGALLAHLAAAGEKTRSPAARALLERGARETQEYLAVRRTAEQQAPTVQGVIDAVAPQLDRALDTMGELANLELDNVSVAEGKARRWDRIANVIGLTSAALVLLGFFGVAIGMNRLVYRPLLALSEAIDSFAAGKRHTRVEAGGTLEFQRTASSFNSMARRLERQQEELLTFLAGVAHDLRNPLAALRMSVQYLDSDRPLPPEPKVRHTMGLVNRQVSRLERMVGDFLDACRIESGHLELVTQRRDLRDLAQEATELYEASSFSHKIVLHAPEEPILVDCDAERLGQVLNNLLSNAIKYSPNGGVVEIDVGTVDGEATISVTDHGIGIAKQDLEQVFQPFRRTGPSRETIPGVGLGLSVARRIVEAHGGRIEVESEPGAGSTFTVNVPRANVAVASETIEVNGGSDARRDGAARH
jgi:two-component system sensor histidine kinase MtrB